MDIETAGKTIQLILAPVVMVTACGILLSGMLSHYAVINDRIRYLVAQRLDLVFVPPGAGHVALAHERLIEIDHQVPMLVRRHTQVHHAILLATGAVVILVLSMFVIAAAALTKSSVVGTVALFIFLAGTASLMSGATFMAMEVRSSNASVSYEATRVAALPINWSDETSGAEGDR